MKLTPTPSIVAAAQAPSPKLPSEAGVKAPAAGKPSPSEAASSDKAAKLLATPVAEAAATVTKHLDKVVTMKVGGGTKEGVAAAMKAAAMLEESSVLTQIVHRNAMKSNISPDLEMNLVLLATQLASASSNVAFASQVPKEIELSKILAKPAKQGAAILAAVVDHVGRTQQAAANPSPAGYL